MAVSQRLPMACRHLSPGIKVSPPIPAPETLGRQVRRASSGHGCRMRGHETSGAPGGARTAPRAGGIADGGLPDRVVSARRRRSFGQPCGQRPKTQTSGFANAGLAQPMRAGPAPQGIRPFEPCPGVGGREGAIVAWAHRSLSWRLALAGGGPGRDRWVWREGQEHAGCDTMPRPWDTRPRDRRLWAGTDVGRPDGGTSGYHHGVAFRLGHDAAWRAGAE